MLRTQSELLQDKICFINMKIQQAEREYTILKRRKKKNKGCYLYFDEVILNQKQVLLQQDIVRTERSQWRTHTHIWRLNGTYQTSYRKSEKRTSFIFSVQRWSNSPDPKKMTSFELQEFSILEKFFRKPRATESEYTMFHEV